MIMKSLAPDGEFAVHEYVVKGRKAIGALNYGRVSSQVQPLHQSQAKSAP